MRAKNLYNRYLVLVNASHPYLEEKVRLLPVCPGEPDILLEEQAQRQLSLLMEEMGGWEDIVPVSGWRSRKDSRRSLILPSGRAGRSLPGNLWRCRDAANTRRGWRSISP